MRSLADDQTPCSRCAEAPRWGQGIWCRNCIYETCCRNYPDQIYDRVRQVLRRVDCVHGDRIRREMGHGRG